MSTHAQAGSIDLSTLNKLHGDLTQYFWNEKGGSGTYPWGVGAHITLYPQNEFTDSSNVNYLRGKNVLINTDGFSLRNGNIPLMVLDDNSLDFNLITDLYQGVYVNVATFGTNGATIGNSNTTHIHIGTDSVDFYKNATNKIATIVYGTDEGGEADPNIVGFYMPYGTYGVSGFDIDTGNYGSIALFRRENNSAMNTSGIVISRANASTSDVSLYNIRDFDANCNGYFANVYSNGETLHHITIKTKDIKISNLAHGTSKEGSVVLSSGGGTFEGYLARCVVGWAPSGTNSSWLRAWRLFVNQNKDGDGKKRTLEYGIRNENNSNAVTGSLKVYILCTQ